MLTAASLLIAVNGKSEEELLLRDWDSKVRYMCLISQLTAISRYRAAEKSAITDFNSHWECFANSKHSKIDRKVKDCILSIL